MAEKPQETPQGKAAEKNIQGVQKLDQIRDLIYDYVDITPFERIIIEDPYFQRLRFIFQNSSAYLTYPSNQLTRFSHSIGVMHIGGLMYSFGLLNSDVQVRKEFYEKNKAVLIKKIQSYELGDYEELKKSWANGEYKSYAKLGFETIPDESFVFNIYWQALRIACLCHDIGHLPFSHIFEMAIDEFNDRNKNEFGLDSSLKNNCIDEIQAVFKISVRRNIKATDLHELIGAYLLCGIFNLNKDLVNIDNKILKLSLGLAIEMFLHGKRDYGYNDPDQELFNCYYNLISSDLDADRLDYILRDAKSSGLNLGNFDYTRILMHLQLVSIRKNKEGKGDAFRILPSEKSISSIDQFFNYRYLMYEYVYYHHNVAKYDGILIEILCRVFQEIIFGENEKLGDLCINRFNLLNSQFELFPLKRESAGMAYEYYDDCWLRSFLHDLYRLNLFNDPGTTDLIKTFLFRAKANTISWVKNSVQIDKYLSDSFFQKQVEANKNFRLKYFIENNNSISNELKKEIDKWKATLEDLKPNEQLIKLRELINKVPEDLVGPLQLHANDVTRVKFRFYLNEKAISKPFVSELLGELRSSLLKIGVVLIVKNVPPKLLSTDPKEAQNIIVKDRGLKFLTDASFYLENLKNLSNTHFKYYFAFFKKDLNDKSSASEQLRVQCSQEVSNFLFKVMDEGLLLKVRDKVITT